MSASNQLRILTLNCWGLKYISKNRVARINAIANLLSTASYDFVCLQELFVSQDFETIRAAVSNLLPYAKVFHGGAVGQGLAVFSRFPILATSVQRYSLNGSPLDLAGFDWAAGKGAASILVKHPVLGQVHIFNTHFYSEGGDDGPEHNRAHRLVNAWEFAKLVKQAAELGHHVIAAGDFNSAPHTLPMTVLLQHAGLCDTWASLHSPTSSTHSGVNAIEASSLHGFTYGSPLNSYSPVVQPNAHAPAPQRQRLDYILFRNPATPTFPSSETFPQLVLTEANVTLKDFIPGHEFSYSDHFGVEATFRIDLPEPKNLLLPDTPTDGNVPSTPYTAAPVPPEKTRLTRHQMLVMIDALKTHLRRHKVRARLELRVFIACLVVLICTLIGTGWSPRGFLTPVFVFVGAFSTWLGTTMFHVGLLYGRWEVSLLQNIIGELELYVQTIEGN